MLAGSANTWLHRCRCKEKDSVADREVMAEMVECGRANGDQKDRPSEEGLIRHG